MPRRTRQPATDPKLAVAYLRVSTEDQSLGPDAQLAAIERWAAAEGVHIVSVCRDINVSGAAELADRPGLLEALAELEARGAGVLVVAKRDRLARSVLIAAMVEADAEKKGARIASADGLNVAGPEGQLMRTMIDAFAAYERALIRGRTKAALAVKRARGERLGKAPIGWVVYEPGGQLVADDVEQAAVARIRELRAEGTSIRQIAARLNVEGVPARGSKWHPTSVQRVLERAQAAA